MDSAFESIKAGLVEAIAHAGGNAVGPKLHQAKVIDVKAIRAQVGMSQTEFASSFGISIGTLRHWERGDRQPQGPARVLLQVVSKQPAIVLAALAA